MSDITDIDAALADAEAVNAAAEETIASAEQAQPSATEPEEASTAQDPDQPDSEPEQPDSERSQPSAEGGDSEADEATHDSADVDAVDLEAQEPGQPGSERSQPSAEGGDSEADEATHVTEGGDSEAAEATHDEATHETEEPAPRRRRDSPYDRPGRWYVIHTQSGYENKVRSNLLARTQSMNMEERIFEVVIPLEDVVEFKNGKKVVVQKKVFPGYLLTRMHLDDDSWFVVRNTPGVTGFIGAGNKPSPLPRKDVETFLVGEGGRRRAEP